jgi:hypothetical protein
MLTSFAPVVVRLFTLPSSIATADAPFATDDKTRVTIAPSDKKPLEDLTNPLEIKSDPDQKTPPDRSVPSLYR